MPTSSGQTQVLLDNSSFAGVMRCYEPKLEPHRRFIKRYPQHRAIDEASLADFITALCLYDRLLIESSSIRTVPQSGAATESSTVYWVDSLKPLLPPEISSLIERSDLSAQLMNEDYFMQRAYNILNSSMKDSLVKDPISKLPSVYSAKDYFFRQRFEQMNANHAVRLSEKDLVLAMFLHRGLLLQAVASQSDSVYLPYLYRGRLLSNLPPMAWAPVENLGDAPSLPFARNTRSGGSDNFRSLDKFYYELVEAVTWTAYSSDIPFIGASILARAKGNVREALTIAMDYRKEGGLKRMSRELNRAVQESDRPRFESLLERYKAHLTAAAAHFGKKGDTGKQQTFYKLVVSWIPDRYKAVTEAAVSSLPTGLKDWGYRVSSTLITEKPLQMLFVGHVNAIQGGSWLRRLRF